MMDQRKEQRVCIKFCANLGKVLWRPSQWFNKPLGTKAWVVHRCFNGMPGSRLVAKSVDDDEHTGRPRSCTILETVARIQELVRQDWRWPFTTLQRSWELVVGHANRFWRKNWACTMSQPILCPGSWQLTTSSSTSTSALKFVSSPPMMKPSCPGSSLVMRAGFTVTTLRQSNNPPSGKAPCHQGQKGPDEWKAMSRIWSSLSLTSRGLCTKNLSQQAKLWILDSTVKFCGACMKTCEDIVPNFGENRPGRFTITMPHVTLTYSPNSFWQKTEWLSSPTHHTPLIWHPVTSSYFQKWNRSWKDAGLIPSRYRLNRRECLTLWWKRTYRKCSKNKGDGGTGVYMREGTTSRVTVADRPYGEFYDFYSVSPENFGLHLVCQFRCQHCFWVTHSSVCQVFIEAQSTICFSVWDVCVV